MGRENPQMVRRPYLVEEDSAGEDKGGLAGGPRAVDPLVFMPLMKSCEPANQSMAVLTPHPVLHSTHKNKKAHSVIFLSHFQTPTPLPTPVLYRYLPSSTISSFPCLYSTPRAAY